MASGKTHNRVARTATQAMAVGGLLWIASLYVAGEEVGSLFSRFLVFLFGMIIGIWIEPDLDMIQITSSERRKLDKRPVLGRLWLALWAPYGAIMSHRGISHAPVLGTFTRVAYLSWPVFLYCWLADVSIDPVFFEFFLFLLAGWVVQDFIHLGLDRFGFNWRI